MNLAEKLNRIQCEMKAPKDLWNNFGKYKYRNAEGIFEAFKPYADKYKVILIVTDSIVNEGERYYVKATATLMDNESIDSITVSALAREDEVKKGMDGSQITGTASSYARKYAMNGLFLLDDTKDADTDEHAVEKKARAEKAPAETEKITAKEWELIKKMCQTKMLNPLDVIKKYGATKASEVTKDALAKILEELK